MPCYKPLAGFRSRFPGVNGGYPIVFDRRKSNGQTMSVPCGQCIGCRLDRSREWAIRCYHEASLYGDNNSFITLTYRPEDLPENGTLVKSDFQKFMKRLRKANSGKKIRFFHCGEYGEKLSRPHYHACLFNHTFQDQELLWSKEGIPLYRSNELERLWPFGFATIGEVTFESAAYVARYILKKVNGKQAEEHYKTIDKETGEIISKQPEYTTMSRRPGIGRDWYEKYKEEVFPADSVVIDTKVLKPPRFYTQIYQNEEPEKCEMLKKARVKSWQKRAKDSTPERLAVREKCKQKQVERLIREIEEN